MDEVRHPEVQVNLSGDDGNMAMIIGRVRRSLRRAKVDDAEITEFTEEVTASESYDEALQVIMRWVDVS